MSIKKLDNPRVWRTYTGGKLIDELHNKSGLDNNYPEEWIMSTTKAINPNIDQIEGLSYILNDKITLKEYIELDPKNILGKEFVSKYGNNTSVLVKFIDSLERLTLQVHPSRLDAKKYFNSNYGKTECWYFLGRRVVDGVNPYVYIGFKHGVTKNKWIDLFNKQDIDGMLSCLNKIDVKEGDCFFIEGGIPHAIGSGCFLIEIQEPTDYTLRVEKTTPKGLVIDDHLIHQGLGFDQMFDIFNYQTFDVNDIKSKYMPVIRKANDYTNTIIGYETTEYFKLNELLINKTEFIQESSFYGLVVLEGNGVFKYNDIIVEYKKGEQFFIPAFIDIIEVVPNIPSRIIQAFGPKI